MDVEDVCPDETLAAPAWEIAALSQYDEDQALVSAALSANKPRAAPAAYSEEPPELEEAQDASTAEPASRIGAASRYALPILLVLITAGAFVVSAALLMERLGHHGSASTNPGSAATQTAAPTTVEAAATPAVSAARLDLSLEQLPTMEYVTPPPDPDDAYLAALRRSGLSVIDPARAVASGRAVCQFLGQGHTKVDATRAAVSLDPSLSVMDAARFVVAAVNVYCPQYQ